MKLHRLTTVDAFVAFDLDDCEANAGGTRFAPDVTEAEVALLARAMTYKYAVLGLRMGGAKGAVRGDPREREALMRRYCDEIRPLCERMLFLTAADLGTFESDFTTLRPSADTFRAMTTAMDGVAFEDIVTGFGVVAAAEAALGPLAGTTFAIEGFGKVGGGVAREAVRRGGRVTAVSTIVGTIRSAAGFDVEELWRLRSLHGDALVEHAGTEVLPTAALFETPADVLVPGARTGVIDVERSRRLPVRVVAPAANVPYVAGTPAILHARGVLALADFVCNAGGVIGYLFGADSSHADVLRSVEQRIREMTAQALAHPDGPFAGACASAHRFLRTWREGEPPPPPLA